MTFFFPERLWLLLAVVALVAAYVFLQSRRRSYALRYTNLPLLASVAPKRPGWRRHVPAALFLIALSTLVVGFAEPAAEQRVPRERATIILAIDTSLSMEATDVSPKRIDAAKVAAKSFVDKLPPKINVAVLAFDGRASLKVPPTTDHERLKRSIDGLSLGQGTAIGEAVFASLDAIKSVPADEEGTPPPSRIVLMSDGSTTVGRPNEAGGEAAKEAKVPVSTIAFGTDSGTIRIPESPGPVRVPVDAEALRALADQTGGKAFDAASAEELQQVYTDIGSSVGYTTELSSIASWFIGAALIVLVATAGLSLLWFSRLP